MTYRTTDFRPSGEPGWRALYVLDDGTSDVVPVVGWLVQEWWRENESGRVQPTPRTERERRVIAAIDSPDAPGALEAVDHCEDLMDYHPFIQLLPPGEPEPDAAAITRIHAERIKARDDVLDRRARKAAEDAPKLLAFLVRSGGPWRSELIATDMRIPHRRATEALYLLQQQGSVTIDDKRFWTVIAPGAA